MKNKDVIYGVEGRWGDGLLGSRSGRTACQKVTALFQVHMMAQNSGREITERGHDHRDNASSRRDKT